MRAVKKMRIRELQSELQVLNESQRKAILGGGPGNYTWDEANAMMGNGTWTGGYIDGVYTLPNVNVYGTSPTSSISSVVNADFSDIWVNSSPWMQSILSDVISQKFPVAGDAMNIYNIATDLHAAYNGQDASGKLARDLIDLAPYGSTLGTLLTTMGNGWNSLDSAIMRYVYVRDSIYFNSGFPN
jgi:hypothetical protein